MELKDFIERTITDISTGVSKAISNVSDANDGNRVISPAYVEGVVNSTPKDIKFDIAVTYVDEKNISGEGGIKINVCNLGANGEKKSTKEVINRIQFEVPFYPQALK